MMPHWSMTEAVRLALSRRFILLIMLSPLSLWAENECPQNWPAAYPCPVSHAQTVVLEHNDRKNRLVRLSHENLYPVFSTEFLTPLEHGLEQYPIDIPVLRVAFNSDVFFDTGQSQIRPEAYPILQTIAQNMTKEPADVALFIVGHTDSQGQISYNYNLGLDRADAVAKAIARRGVYKASIYRLSFGELSPQHTNNTALGRARNRRVEFLFAATVSAAQTWVKKQPIEPCIAKNTNEMSRCRKVIEIKARKIAVDHVRAREISAINSKEAELKARTDISEEELKTALEEVELRRAKIPVNASRDKVVVSVRRKVVKTTKAGL